MFYFLFLIYNILITIFYWGYFILFPVHYLINSNKAINRIGKLPKFKKIINHDIPIIWIHAVSGGEVKLVDKIRRNHLPHHPLLITYMSNSGSDMAHKLFDKEELVVHGYLPFDNFWIMKNWMTKLNPSHLVIIEHDFWINQLFLANKFGVKTAFVNYRLKKKDKSNYEKFPFSLRLTHQANFIYTQNKNDETWLKKKLSSEIKSVGNLKYDFNPSVIKEDSTLAKLKKSLKKKHLITLGSSHQGEEELFVDALADLVADHQLLLVVIPRHIDRLDKIIKTILNLQSFKSNQLKLNIYQELQDGLTGNKKSLVPDIIVVDRMGILESIYKVSDLALIGDSFIPSQGGHNFLESIQFGCPTIYGEYYKSFEDMTPDFEKLGGVLRVPAKNSKALKETVYDLVTNPQELKRMGETGLGCLKKLSYNRTELDNYFSN